MCEEHARQPTYMAATCDVTPGLAVRTAPTCNPPVMLPSSAGAQIPANPPLYGDGALADNTLSKSEPTSGKRGKGRKRTRYARNCIHAVLFALKRPLFTAWPGGEVKLHEPAAEGSDNARVLQTDEATGGDPADILHTGRPTQGASHRAPHTGRPTQGVPHRASYTGRPTQGVQHRASHTGHTTQFSPPIWVANTGCVAPSGQGLIVPLMPLGLRTPGGSRKDW
eukprot:366044-Chlamydomonas_euryale.AAC.8